MQVLPSPALATIIKHYLYIADDGAAVKKLRLFSDGNTGMVFCLRNQLITGFTHSGLPNLTPASFFYGQLAAYKDLYASGPTILLVVVFHPTGITQLTGINAATLLNQVISTEQLFGRDALTLEDALQHQGSTENKFNILNTFFLKKMKSPPVLNHTLAESILQIINARRGLVTSAHLQKLTGYTEKHIERKLMESAACTPKKMANITRLHYFLRCVRNNALTENLTALAYEAGYSDQSHLVKEFKKYTGLTPSAYLKNSYKLSVNLVELSPLYSS